MKPTIITATGAFAEPLADEWVTPPVDDGDDTAAPTGWTSAIPDGATVTITVIPDKVNKSDGVGKLKRAKAKEQESIKLDGPATIITDFDPTIKGASGNINAVKPSKQMVKKAAEIAAQAAETAQRINADTAALMATGLSKQAASKLARIANRR